MLNNDGNSLVEWNSLPCPLVSIPNLRAVENEWHLAQDCPIGFHFVSCFVFDSVYSHLFSSPLVTYFQCQAYRTHTYGLWPSDSAQLCYIAEWMEGILLNVTPAPGQLAITQLWRGSDWESNKHVHYTQPKLNLVSSELDPINAHSH